MNIINITPLLYTVRNLIIVGLKSGIFLAILFNILYADTCLAIPNPFVENQNSQELVTSDSRENETSKDE
jgi:hypothetical protein